jgi:hypothetical protein
VSQRGDLLIFVAGMADITALTAALRVYAAENKRCVRAPSTVRACKLPSTVCAAENRRCVRTSTIGEASLLCVCLPMVCKSSDMCLDVRYIYSK